MTHPDALQETERLKLKSVRACCPELDALARHIRSFGQMLTQLHGEQLPEWIAAVRADDLPSLHTFTNGLERDLAAVTAGLTLPWSSGVVEGHVNRIKMMSSSRGHFSPPALTEPYVTISRYTLLLPWLPDDGDCWYPGPVGEEPGPSFDGPGPGVLGLLASSQPSVLRIQRIR
ncbi:transposase [Streptomyces sp. NBC_01320]|nr:transposase [Streptomyces sp. NBC_01320]